MSTWDKNKIIKNISLKQSNFKYLISKPFYDKTKRKAMIIVAKSNGLLDGSTNIVLFKKDSNGKWNEVGELLVSIS